MLLSQLYINSFTILDLPKLTKTRIMHKESIGSFSVLTTTTAYICTHRLLQKHGTLIARKGMRESVWKKEIKVSKDLTDGSLSANYDLIKQQ